MSGILSIPVLPLETLPGWPPVAELSGVQLFGGIIGVPVLLALLLALITYAPVIAGRSKDKSFSREPLVLGAAFTEALAQQPNSTVAHGASLPATRQAVSYVDEPVPSFSQSQVDAFERALLEAEDRSGMRFALYVGAPEGDRQEFGRRFLSGQREPASTVVLIVDPDSHAVEIATGSEAARRISDADCALAAANLQAATDRQDVADGIVNALNLLGGAARDLPIRNQPDVAAIER